MTKDNSPTPAKPLPSLAENRVDIRFEGLQAAITPINLMFDGTLYRDLKSLSSHVLHAKKRLTGERPDYQGALNEIGQLESTFKSAVGQWEKKLTGEIKRLKTAIEKDPDKALGATKKINKYQAELNNGKGSIRSMPSKISQVKNQLLAVAGEGAADDGTEERDFAVIASPPPKNRFSSVKQTLPIVYVNAAKQILRQARKRIGSSQLKKGDNTFHDLALMVFKSVSKPIRSITNDDQISTGTLYCLPLTILAETEKDEVAKQKLQFIIVNDLNNDGDRYLIQSIFSRETKNLEVATETFESWDLQRFEPLETIKVVGKLLSSKFKYKDFNETFNRYHLLRLKAAEQNRDEKFNPKQADIHKYLREHILPFVGVTHANIEDEIAFVGQINRQLQR